jgi:hypothetical protein
VRLLISLDATSRLGRAAERDLGSSELLALDGFAGSAWNMRT